MSSMVVHLSKDLERLVQEKVETGRYRSPDDVISKALHVLDERD
jgi:putative addiction module CopG family antidote